MSKSLYLDTNVFIALFESRAPNSNALWEFINSYVEQPGVVFGTGALSFAELLVKPYRNKDDILVRQYLSLAKFEDWLKVYGTEAGVIDAAAVIRARLGLRLPDALHLASAVVNSCDYFLTFDVGFTSVPPLDHPISGKPLSASIEVVRPDPIALSELARALQ